MVCNGKGCKTCNDYGKFFITSCPLNMLNSEMMQVIDMAEMYLDHGLPMVAGGQMDQPKAFMDITRFVARERMFWENAR